MVYPPFTVFTRNMGIIDVVLRADLCSVVSVSSLKYLRSVLSCYISVIAKNVHLFVAAAEHWVTFYIFSCPSFHHFNSSYKVIASEVLVLAFIVVALRIVSVSVWCLCRLLCVELTASFCLYLWLAVVPTVLLAIAFCVYAATVNFVNYTGNKVS